MYSGGNITFNKTSRAALRTFFLLASAVTAGLLVILTPSLTGRSSNYVAVRSQKIINPSWEAHVEENVQMEVGGRGEDLVEDVVEEKEEKNAVANVQVKYSIGAVPAVVDQVMVLSGFCCGCGIRL